MTTDELCRALGLDRARPPWASKLSISKRCQCGGIVDGVPTLAVGGECKPAEQRGALLDLVHWVRQEHELQARGRFALGAGPHLPAVKEQVATMLDALNRRMEITVDVDLEPQRGLRPPDFNDRSAQLAGRAEQLTARARASAPKLVALLDGLTGDEFFVYRNIAGPTWYGKVEGLGVCAFARDGGSGALRIGADRPSDPENKRLVRTTFRRHAGADEIEFDEIGTGGRSDVRTAAGIVAELVRERRDGDLAETNREARLEDRVLRGLLPIEVDGTVLTPTSRWGQFPTLWASDQEDVAPNTFLDVLMRDGMTPWALELKEPKNASRGEYYRHAVAQAVLYRHFIRSATPLHAWFSAQEPPMDAAACRAAVGFPAEDGASLRQLSRIRRSHGHVRDLAELFDVHVVLVPEGPA